MRQWDMVTNQKTATIITRPCSQERFACKYQMRSEHVVCTPVNWPEDSQNNQFLAK